MADSQEQEQQEEEEEWDEVYNDDHHSWKLDDHGRERRVLITGAGGPAHGYFIYRSGAVVAYRMGGLMSEIEERLLTDTILEFKEESHSRHLKTFFVREVPCPLV